MRLALLKALKPDCGGLYGLLFKGADRSNLNERLLRKRLTDENR